MAIKMNDKFDKYWENYNRIYEIAVLLDPSRKLEYVEFIFSRLYSLHEYIRMRTNETLKLLEIFLRSIVGD